MGYVQKTAQKQPEIEHSAGMKTFKISKLEDYLINFIRILWFIWNLGLALFDIIRMEFLGKKIVFSNILGFLTHIPNCENVYVNFSSFIYPGSKRGKSYENMKISKCCKLSCTSSFVFKWKINVNWTFPLPTLRQAIDTQNLFLLNSETIAVNQNEATSYAKYFSSASDRNFQTRAESK